MVFIAYKTCEMPVAPVGRSAGAVTVKTVAWGVVLHENLSMNWNLSVDSENVLFAISSGWLEIKVPQPVGVMVMKSFVIRNYLRYVVWSPACDPVLSGKKNNRGGRGGTQEWLAVYFPSASLRALCG